MDCEGRAGAANGFAGVIAEQEGREAMASTPSTLTSDRPPARFNRLWQLPLFVLSLGLFGYAAYLYFVDRPRMRHYLWAFALANLISFVVWLALPAAPASEFHVFKNAGHYVYREQPARFASVVEGFLEGR